MTTTASAAPAIGRPARAARAGQASFAGALRSEITKIRSVRSTYWALLALIVICVGIGALGSYGHASEFSHQPQALQAANRAIEVTRAPMISLFGLIVGQLIIAVLGALTVTSEYSTGMIRTSLSVLPW